MKRAVLVIQSPGAEDRVHEIHSEQTLIGRGMHSDVRLADSGISREHAAISWDGDHYSIEDLQSTNGTKVNERRVRSAPLESEDRIQMGQTTLVFRIEG